MRSSMTFSAVATWPTSVRSLALGTRCSRSPPEMRSAVSTTSRNGRSPTRTSQSSTTIPAINAAAVIRISKNNRRRSVEEMSPMGAATTSTSPLVSFDARTRKDGPSFDVEATVKNVTGSCGSLAVRENPVIGVGRRG